MAGAELEGVCFFFREKKDMLVDDKAESRRRIKEATLCPRLEGSASFGVNRG